MHILSEFQADYGGTAGSGFKNKIPVGEDTITTKSYLCVWYSHSDSVFGMLRTV